MYYIDRIEPDFGPRERISQKLPEVPEEIKMRETDSAFLCGLIKRFLPGKIVEVGVANGATSAVILQCLSDLGIAASLHSVDIRYKNYGKKDREIGYLGGQAAELLGAENYRLWKGTALPGVIKKIGPGIDLLILDTNHKLPGETLDFLIALPFMSEGAVVCVHDIRQNHSALNHKGEIGTNALFNSVAAEKYIDPDPIREPDYPNIGAFRIVPDTKKYIMNVFGSLTQNWLYIPDDKQMADYERIIREYYGEEANWLFDRAVMMNRISLSAAAAERNTFWETASRKIDGLKSRIRALGGKVKKRLN